MRTLTDPAEIRAILETDRPWAVYALGDLSPEYFPYCEWLAPAGGSEPSLLLVCRAFTPAILFAMGDPEALRPALLQVRDPALNLSIPPGLLSILEERYEIESASGMWRMLYRGGDLLPPADAMRLRVEDLPAVEALYEDGRATGEAPDFFHASSLETGTCYGIWFEGRLIAAAGTHQAVPSEGTATVGNVYVRRDFRGRGLGRQVTAAVVAELRRRGTRTIALNVKQTNHAAIRVYEQLGFECYRPFLEGTARLR